MKKLKLSGVDLDSMEILSRLNLKNILGGSGPPEPDNCVENCIISCTSNGGEIDACNDVCGRIC